MIGWRVLLVGACALVVGVTGGWLVVAPEPEAGAGGDYRPPASEGFGPARTVLAETRLDLTGDGESDRLVVAAAIDRDAEGRPMWDDGQRWTVHVDTAAGVRPLFADFVANGGVAVRVVEPVDASIPEVLVTVDAGAGYTLIRLRYDSADEAFTGDYRHRVAGNRLWLGIPTRD